MELLRKAATIALLSTAICGSANADFVGLNIGVNTWNPDITGSFSSGSDTDIQLGKGNGTNGLGYSDYSSTGLSVSFEHPIPLIPNVRYQRVDLDASSNSNVSNLTYEGSTYTGAINSKLDLSHNDIALYYEVLDNWINIDVGLDLKTFDGTVSIANEDGSNSSSIDVDKTIPMLYLAARFDLPLTGFYVGANIQQLSIGDNSAEDTTFMVGYESSMGLGIEGGIKSFTLELDDASDLNTNLEYDGLFLNGYFHF